jgi:tRNA(Ile)-lysidine synthase
MSARVFMSLAKQHISSSEINLAAGKYVVAVSGGVDSMVLLDLLLEKPELELVVAHIDHGIRDNSTEDRKFVEHFALSNKIKFYYKEALLGPDASEELARNVRYEYLYELKNKLNARAILTAHHQDDVIETAILNMIRGTGRSGLSALKDQIDIYRPLLGFSKKQIIEYAIKHNVAWVEDETNSQLVYLRNYVRLRLVPKFNKDTKSRLLGLIDQARNLNVEIDALLDDVLESLSYSETSIDRKQFIGLNHQTSKELFRAWLKDNGVQELNSKNLEDLTILAKTLKKGKNIDVDANFILKIDQNLIELVKKS